MDNLIFTMWSKGWVTDILRSFLFMLDKMIYTVFSWIMQLIFDIVEVSSQPELQSFYGEIQARIYAVLAIFMLFKITISMLNYLVNPDSISDKERGMGKLVSRVIVALIMLIAFPNAFSLLNRLQTPLLQALPRVILGTEESTSDSLGNQMASEGERIAFDVYNGVWFNSNCADKNNVSGLDPYGKKANKCFMHGNTIEAIEPHLNDAADGDASSYRYEYMPIIGFVVGIVMTLVMLGICIDVAIRVFKLMILELIAPIPILSYIDPKSSKDGAFSKWIKMVMSTYLDVFLKMGIVYFVVLVISKLITTGVIIDITVNIFGENGYVRGGFVLVALVIGLLFFAKSAPKFIMDALGIKSSGNFMRTLGMGAAALGTVGSGIGATAAGFKKGGLSAVTAIPKGIISSGRSALAAGNALMSTDKPTFSTGLDAQRKFNARNLANIRAGYGVGNQALSLGRQLFTGHDIDSDINATKAIVDTSDKLMGYAMGEGEKKLSANGYTIGTDLGFNVSGSLNGLKAAIAHARSTGTNVIFDHQDLGAVDGSTVTKLLGDYKERLGDEFLKECQSNADYDTSGGLSSLQTSYANAMGISIKDAKSKRVSGEKGLKRDKKSNETKLFNLEQARGPKN